MRDRYPSLLHTHSTILLAIAIKCKKGELARNLGHLSIIVRDIMLPMQVCSENKKCLLMTLNEKLSLCKN